MVPKIHHVPLGDCLDLGKIHHHAVRRVACPPMMSPDSVDFERITMAVQVPALALVVGDSVTGVEFEAAGDLHGQMPCGRTGKDYIIGAEIPFEPTC